MTQVLHELVRNLVDVIQLHWITIFIYKIQH